MNAFHHSSGGTAHTLAVAGIAVQFVSGDFSTPTVPYVRVQIQDDDVYATYDGTAPSAANGEILRADSSAYFLLLDLLEMKFIQVAGAARIFAQPCNFVSPASATQL